MKAANLCKWLRGITLVRRRKKKKKKKERAQDAPSSFQNSGENT